MRPAPHQGEDPLHLDVVEVGRRFIGHHQRRFVHEGPGDGHPLLLAAGHLTRPVIGAFGQPDLGQQLVGPGAASRRGTLARRMGAMTLPRAVRLGIRLKAWNTTLP